MQGIFRLLEDESKKRAPSASNLHNMIIKTSGDKAFKNDALKLDYCFVIRHFSKDVCYSTVHFIH